MKMNSSIICTANVKSRFHSKTNYPIMNKISHSPLYSIVNWKPACAFRTRSAEKGGIFSGCSCWGSLNCWPTQESSVTGSTQIPSAHDPKSVLFWSSPYALGIYSFCNLINAFHIPYTHITFPVKHVELRFPYSSSTAPMEHWSVTPWRWVPCSSSMWI